MRAFLIIEGSQSTISDQLSKLQTQESEFKIEGFSARQTKDTGFEIAYSVLVSWLRVV